MQLSGGSRLMSLFFFSFSHALIKYVTFHRVEKAIGILVIPELFRLWLFHLVIVDLRNNVE